MTTSGGENHRPYSVFENRESGKKCVVICNYDYKETVEVFVGLDDGAKIRYCRLVDEDDWHEVNGFISIPPSSAIIGL